MGNLCFRPESIRKIEIEIEGLRNDIARLDKDRKASEMKAEGREITVSGGRGSKISDQTTAATMRRAVGHHGGLIGHGESKAIEELWEGFLVMAENKVVKTFGLSFRK
ncbi:hypothetical protein B9Z19DRAFT_1122687 [Tuber borchii]|uniref:Uncharacterized protein n=1 Tax=Tuber borchii TaxID=42251 RepID=A0A2T7A030_TUBBO|nr:hypothetical protein B9Z19DRAFT_1122687 [Tuber borchii]